jgi:hypothetical protein
MENASGQSPLQSLALTECFAGKTDQEILDIIARHLSFTAEAGESIQGDAGIQGPAGPSGANGADGVDGITPTPNTAVFADAEGVSDTITEFDIPFTFDIVVKANVKLVFGGAGAAPANSSITHFQDVGASTTRVFFDAALSGAEWEIHVTVWS